MSLFYDKTAGIYSTTPRENVNLQRLIQVYTSQYIKERTEPLKDPNLTDEQKQELKKFLPFVTPYCLCTQRNKASVYHLNSNIICLDFDKLSTSEARYLKHQLSQHPSTILTAISPRQKGVKAIIRLPEKIDSGLELLQQNNTHLTKMIDCLDLEINRPSNHAIENHYYFQKHNLPAILDKLGITHEADDSQLRIVQPFFIAYDSELFYNLNAEPLEITLQEYIPNERPLATNTATTSEKQTADVKPSNYDHRTAQRIAGVIRKKARFIADDLRNNTGTRHPKIARCIDVLEIVHYLPEIKGEILDTLKQGIADLYGTEAEAIRSNAFCSFEALQNTIQNRRNELIENIIKGQDELK